jgi:NAD-dependent protein deacetylase/lipoamidase
MPKADTEPVDIPAALAVALAGARRVAVLTGAGVSAESGVPTFRDAQTGLWSKFRPEELATLEAFVRNPQMVWEWYRHRREKLAAARPNPGHYALAEIERRVAAFTLVTQNIDGLHATAGSRHFIELHGNILRNKCFDAGHPAAEADDTVALPRCKLCDSLLRPDVVWFGEMLPPGAMEQASEAARTSEVFLCVGTSAVVYPAAQLPQIARAGGAIVVEVNPEPSAVADFADFTLAAPAGIALPALVAASWAGAGRD